MSYEKYVLRIVGNISAKLVIGGGLSLCHQNGDHFGGKQQLAIARLVTMPLQTLEA